MKVIIEHDGTIEDYLLRYTTARESISPYHTIVEIAEQYLNCLNNLAQYIEPNFLIQLTDPKERIDTEWVLPQATLIAYIGHKPLSDADFYYPIHTPSKVNIPFFSSKKATMISCYSHTKTIDAIEYIQCIRHLTQCAKELGQRLIIYTAFKVPHETYRYRTLTYKIANDYLKQIQGFMIHQCEEKEIYKYHQMLNKAYEPYIDHTIYLEEKFNEAIKKVLRLCYPLAYHSRQNESLYQDIFYQQIPPEEYIYVLLNSSTRRMPAYYQSLGLQTIAIVDQYTMLYGMKSQFDAVSEVLRPDVLPQYSMPIVSHVPCKRGPITSEATSNIAPPNLQYQGEGVYIGLISVDPVDYTNSVLRDNNGMSRIAYIWQQTRSDQGNTYLKEQINGALMDSDPAQKISLPEGESMSTAMFAIAGGLNSISGYRGVATRAEFVIAQILPASDAIQKIYGGSPSPKGVTFADVLVGVIKLIDFAREQKKPLVLCIPFNGNIDPHDGSFAINQIFDLLSRQDSISIITPAGDEADKEHHYEIQGVQPNVIRLNLSIQRQMQSVVGFCCNKFANIMETWLYPPANISIDAIDLQTSGIYELNQTTIYSNGRKFNFSNGAQEILFRLDNPSVGNWRIEMMLETNEISKIDIWISQEELNEFAILVPSSPFITLGSTAATQSVINVGAYNEEDQIVIRTSGRGYSWDNRVEPSFVTHASQILAPCNKGEWMNLSGTLPAASIISGATAILYSKLLREEIAPLPNTVIMNSIMLSHTERFEGVEYPNPNQGYGIFNLDILRQILARPFSSLQRR